MTPDNHSSTWDGYRPLLFNKWSILSTSWNSLDKSRYARLSRWNEVYGIYC